jgi:glycosyltransferase involved in cell wall biosynthesis
MARQGLRVGWATSAWNWTPGPTFRGLPAAVAMRVANVARWINRNDRPVRNELYRPDNHYDIVVFVKAMDERTRAEAERVQGYGGKVVFDANVNYYEIWGEYDVPETMPTEEQRRDATEMTQKADWVVADSSYLLEVVSKLNHRASWIPDNVDTRLFRPARRRATADFGVVWSGMANKARPLLDIREPLAAADAKLVVVSNEQPAELDELRRAIPTRFVLFSPRRYARVLRALDVIVSPKRLVNGYELGHTEWKITLGMAAGLPAVASPQQSYREAIEYRGGGIVADGQAAWREALLRLRDEIAYRRDLGDRARKTVQERYATPVVARQYLELFRKLA